MGREPRRDFDARIVAPAPVSDAVTLAFHVHHVNADSQCRQDQAACRSRDQRNPVQTGGTFLSSGNGCSAVAARIVP